MSASKLMMRAIRVSEFGGPAVLKLCSDVAVPEPGPRQVRPGSRSCWAPLAGQRRAAALIFGAFVQFCSRCFTGSPPFTELPGPNPNLNPHPNLKPNPNLDKTELWYRPSYSSENRQSTWNYCPTVSRPDVFVFRVQRRTRHWSQKLDYVLRNQSHNAMKTDNVRKKGE